MLTRSNKRERGTVADVDTHESSESTTFGVGAYNVNYNETPVTGQPKKRSRRRSSKRPKETKLRCDGARIEERVKRDPQRRLRRTGKNMSPMLQSRTTSNQMVDDAQGKGVQPGPEKHNKAWYTAVSKRIASQEYEPVRSEYMFTEPKQGIIVGTKQMKALQLRVRDQLPWVVNRVGMWITEAELLRLVTPTMIVSLDGVMDVSDTGRAVDYTHVIMTNNPGINNTTRKVCTTTISQRTPREFAYHVARVVVIRIKELCPTQEYVDAITDKFGLHISEQNDAPDPVHAQVSVENLKHMTGREILCNSCHSAGRCHNHDNLQQWNAMCKLKGVWYMLPVQSFGPFLDQVIISYQRHSPLDAETIRLGVNSIYHPYLRNSWTASAPQVEVNKQKKKKKKKQTKPVVAQQLVVEQNKLTPEQKSLYYAAVGHEKISVNHLKGLVGLHTELP
jgi:hypothetical protein